MRGIALCSCQVCGKNFVLLSDCDTLKEVQAWELWASGNYNVCEQCWADVRQIVAARVPG